MVGRSGGRDAVVLQLNYNLDKEDRIKSIQEFRLNGKSIYKDMLAIIKSVDDDNFIKTLDAKFGIAEQKSPLAKHSVTGIKYGFISNTCVSKDPNSEEYAEKSSSCKITFGVWKFGNFEKIKEKK